MFLHTYRISLVQNSKCCKKRTTMSCMTLRIRATMADQEEFNLGIPVTQLISHQQQKELFQYVDLVGQYGKGTRNKMFSQHVLQPQLLHRLAVPENIGTPAGRSNLTVEVGCKGIQTCTQYLCHILWWKRCHPLANTHETAGSEHFLCFLPAVIFMLLNNCINRIKV